MESAAHAPEPPMPAFEEAAQAGADMPAPAARIPLVRPLFLIGIFGWLVPGLGQLLMGRIRKALVMGVAILGLYAGGLALAGFVCVDPDKYGLEFVAHVLTGGPTLLTLHFTAGVTQDVFLPHFEVGRLYVAVAGLLNVVAVSDALGDAMAHNTEVRHLRTERNRSLLEQAATDTERTEPAPTIAAAPASSEPPASASSPTEQGDLR